MNRLVAFVPRLRHLVARNITSTSVLVDKLQTRSLTTSSAFLKNEQVPKKKDDDDEDELEPVDISHIKKQQEFFQSQTGPVYLRGGLKDRILFGITLVLFFIGCGLWIDFARQAMYWP